MTRPDLDDLAVLVLVARTGSIGRAAEQLRLSQPSVSRRMAALEKRMRVLLLHLARHHTHTDRSAGGGLGGGVAGGRRRLHPIRAGTA